ncbi:VOC family protein [Paenibacillus sp. J5C_2022]|uniref:VOC family protein n=1 Tax=Paenibacillus sp. J5C2022 TaxID=2977129 RepID=UPI0021CE6073|nr:VOC family protein [Paenibacillus sp. J5C2022]MCU6707245.1 VOC family protein [Paenibacillus sp. J5C2022]
MRWRQTVPILRIFDLEKAKQFYLDFLSFQIEWEHRFQDDLPLYMQIARNGCILHLTEHHGDCCPGAAVRIGVEDAKSLHTELLQKQYRYARPGYQSDWNEVTVTDPFGNRLHFYTIRDEEEA